MRARETYWGLDSRGVGTDVFQPRIMEFPTNIPVPLPAYSIILSEDRSLDHCPHMSLSLVEAPNDPIKHPLEVGNVKCLTAEVYGEFNSSVIVTSRQYTARNSLTDG